MSPRDSSTAACRGAILAGTGGLKAAFFGYFLCRGKESRCRPAQGQRLRREGANADASEKTPKAKNQKRIQRLRRRQKTYLKPACAASVVSTTRRPARNPGFTPAFGNTILSSSCRTT